LDHQSFTVVHSQSRSSPPATRTLTLGEDLSQIFSDPSDRDPTPQIKSLTEPVWDDLIHPNPFKSNGLSSWSKRSGTSEYRSAMWPCLNQNRIQIGFSNPIWSKSLKNHNF
jgi:hypothetical protein